MRKERVIYSAILVGILIGVVFFSGTTSTVTINDTTVTTTNIAPDGDELFIQGDMNLSYNNLTSVDFLKIGNGSTGWLGLVDASTVSIYKNTDASGQMFGISVPVGIQNNILNNSKQILQSTSMKLCTEIDKHTLLKNTLAIDGFGTEVTNRAEQNIHALRGILSSVYQYSNYSDIVAGVYTEVQSGSNNANCYVKDTIGTINYVKVGPSGRLANLIGTKSLIGSTANMPNAEVNKVYGTYNTLYKTSGSGPTINETYGYYFDGDDRGMTLNNLYGLYLKNISEASGDNYAIYADSGDTYLGGRYTNATGNVSVGIKNHELASSYEDSQFASYKNLSGTGINSLIYTTINDNFPFGKVAYGQYIVNEIPSGATQSPFTSKGLRISMLADANIDVTKMTGIGNSLLACNAGANTERLVGIETDFQTESDVNEIKGNSITLTNIGNNVNISDNYFLYYDTNLYDFFGNSIHINNSYGVYHAFNSNSNTGTIDNSYGYYYDGTTTGTLVNNTYGIYIKNTSSQNDEYAIYVEDGDTLLQNTTIDNVLHLTPVATAPTSPTEGDIYYNSTTHKPYCYNGSAWNPFW